MEREENASLLRRFRLLPTFGRHALRRLRWVLSMTQHTKAHGQAIAAIFGHLEDEESTLDAGEYDDDRQRAVHR